MRALFPIKPVYFFFNFVRYFSPKFLLRWRLKGVLKRAQRRSDWSEIKARVDYYNKLDHSFTLGDDALTLKSHRFFGKTKIQSAYFFDSFEFTRWFPQHLKWSYFFGDVTFIPPIPSIVKSRPIGEDNQNSVVLNLDKYRHFKFIIDSIPYHEKSNKLIFMGDMSNKPIRLKFMEMFFHHPMCYCGDVSRHPSVPAEWQRERMSMEQHLKYKFIGTLEGIDVATNLKWVMSSNSLAVMPKPKYETWFREGALIPNFHYVEIKEDFSDLEERMQFYIDHPEEAEKIIQNAHGYIEQFLNKKRERIISLLVLDKYFRLQEHTL